MEDEKKILTADDNSELDERIRNTANLLAEFAKENLDEELADEILSDLADIINND